MSLWRVVDGHRQPVPVLVAEVVSTNASHDWVRKMRLYARAGVAHYWLLDREQLFAYLLDPDVTEYREGTITESLAALELPDTDVARLMLLSGPELLDELADLRAGLRGA